MITKIGASRSVDKTVAHLLESTLNLNNRELRTEKLQP